MSSRSYYSSLFQEIALLPYRLFGRCSRDASDTLTMGSPSNGPPIPSGVTMSPSRHSLRLLSNGYYICDEESFCWDELGNVSFSPTQCTVSYKENMVRIFRKRRKTLAQRRLDLTNDGHPTEFEEMNDLEPHVIQRIFNCSSENLDFCDSGNTNPCALQEIPEPDHEHVSPGCSSQHVHNDHFHPEQYLTTVHHASPSTKTLQPEHNVEKSANPVPPGTSYNTDKDEKKKDDEQLNRFSCGGYLYVNKDADTCQFSQEMSSWRPTMRRLVKRHSSDSLATTLTPAIDSVCMDVDDTRRSRWTDLTFIFISLLLLYVILWWVRSLDYENVIT
ncbi:transmembrane protein 71 isoform X2 [Engystomops pustulosus]|uniref:transmembrane protein 71 isoform X2 n=1 Tax=Engystomops pustulosus TaxID=76066 RepID=UPI003AFAD890